MNKLIVIISGILLILVFTTCKKIPLWWE